MKNEGTVWTDFPTGKRIRKKKQKYPDELSDWDSCEEDSDAKRNLPQERPSTIKNVKEEISSEYSASEDPDYFGEDLSTQSGTVKRLKRATRKISPKGKSVPEKESGECEFCGYRNWSLAAVSRHVSHNHRRQLTCDVCNFKAKRLEELKFHIKNHIENTGDLSPLPIKEEEDLTKEDVHIKQEPADDVEDPPDYNEGGEEKEEEETESEEESDSEGEKRKTSSNKSKAAFFKCDYCSYSSRQKGHVYRHTRERHLRQTRRGQRLGPFACEVCEFRTTRRQVLDQHVMRHTGEKPYHCGICNFRCRAKANLQRHERTHTGEEPFACNLCEYRCKQGYDLKKHMWTHTGEKPFTCDLCDYSSVQICSLKSHKDRCHRVRRGRSTRKPYVCEFCDFTSQTAKQLYSHLKASHTVVLSKRSPEDDSESNSVVPEHITLQDLGNGEFIKIEEEYIKQEEEYEEIKQEE